MVSPVQTRPGTTGSQPAVDLPEGSIVGEYRIERKLKHGGMGTVYEAVHQMINKRAAVKVLKRELCENDEALHRFVQEARAVNQINHPNIVDVFGFGITEDGRSFLAMELLVGETLGERIARGPLERGDVCEILAEITHALEAAHKCGVVHRDLKPENVFLAETRTGVVVKLLDFGIAKLTGGGGLQGPVEVTQPGTLIGTPKYIAPEQARGLAIEGSADVYALGVIAFELLSGRAPFMANDPVELIAKHITLKPPAPSDFVPTLPPVADELVASMLDKHPPNRPSLERIRELLEQLRDSPDARPSMVESRRPDTTLIGTVTPDPEPGATFVDAEPAGARRGLFRWWMIPLAVGAAALGVRVAVAVYDHSDELGPPPPEAGVVEVAPTAPGEPIITPIEPVTPPDAAPVEPAIDIDPANATQKKPPRKVPATAKQHSPKPKDKPPEVKPPEVKPDEPKPEVKPPDKPKPPDKAKPPVDDDALRDPFHHN